MGGRVVEGTGLENQQAGNRLVGSNPTPSAILRISRQFASLMPPMGRADRAAPAWALGGESELSPSLSAPLEQKCERHSSPILLHYFVLGDLLDRIDICGAVAK